MSGDSRQGPNILVSGTPGTGKSTLVAELLKSCSSMKSVNVSKLALDKNLIEEFDSERAVPIINEDAVLDELEPLIAQGNMIVEYHASEFFPKRFFDRVVVLTTDNTILFDRLKQRGYSEGKIRENVECEIFQILIEEAKESYDEEKVSVWPSETKEDLKRNVDRLREFILEWRENNS
ncbi:unnamed protein product [Notodromas monacha]|uniref:Adenylate kinase isoenzyme 6 homolog n=1 Tax=Notodromas monacha TaxID=399045 RepID=A0A7R9GCU6_9CRUS|nr:unnamed protein product [Notodromas monacha]CAG0917842.1 unnamed protein product [Notodromas monacha]